MRWWVEGVPRRTSWVACAVTEIIPYVDEVDERRGLDIANALGPHDRIGIDDARSFRASLLDHVDLLARIDGEAGGSAIVGHRTLMAQSRQRARDRAARATAPRSRLRLHLVDDFYRARARDLDTIEAVVADNDPESLAFAKRRGFAVDRRAEGPLARPDEDRTTRCGIAAGVSRSFRGPNGSSWHMGCTRSCSRYLPSSLGGEDEQIESFEDWLAHDMQGGPGDRPEATFVAVAGAEVIGFAEALADRGPARDSTP